MKVCVFGIGKMGLPLAAVLAEAGHEVTGVDVNEELVRKVNAGEPCLLNEPGVDALVKKHAGASLRATTDGSAAVADSEIAFIIVPTLITESGEPDLSIVREVAGTIGASMKKGLIIVTECTMPPGATESLASLLEEKSGLKLGEGFRLAHCPERTMSGSAIDDITRKYPKIIGASDEETAVKLEKFYGGLNEKGVITASSIKAAECVKVFEGVYRDVNIALANELARACERLGVNAREAFDAANTQPYCHLHQPSCGVGGHCIPYYPYFVMSEDTPLIRKAREVNDSMPLLTARRLAESGVKSVLVLGLTFRGGVKEFRKSPALEVIKKLKSLGVRVFARDPLCSDDEVRAFGAEPLQGFKGVDAIAACAAHSEFKKINWTAALKEMSGKLVFDGARALDAGAVRKAGGSYSAWGE